MVYLYTWHSSRTLECTMYRWRCHAPTVYIAHNQFLQTTYLFLLVLTIGLFVSILAAEGFYSAKAGQSNKLIYLYLLLLIVVPWLTIFSGISH